MKKLFLLILIIFTSCKKDFDEYEFIKVIILHANETINYSFLKDYLSDGNLKEYLQDTSYISSAQEYLNDFSIGYDIVEDFFCNYYEKNQKPGVKYQIHNISIRSKKKDHKKITFVFKNFISVNNIEWKLDRIIYGNEGLDE